MYRLKRILFITLSLPVFIYIILAVYVATYTHLTPTKSADTALVLGAKAYHSSTYNPCLVSRVNTAVELYKTKKVATLIMSGGNDKEDGVNEAETMRKIALKNILPESNIFLETKATSTFENLKNSQELMKNNHIDSVIIVTEPFHMARARLIARSLHMNAEFAVAQNSPCWEKWKYASKYFLKEPLAILYYLIRGKISLQAF